MLLTLLLLVVSSILISPPTPAFDFFQSLDPPRSFQTMANLSEGRLRYCATLQKSIETMIGDGLEWLKVTLEERPDGTYGLKTSGEEGTDSFPFIETLNLIRDQINLCIDCTGTNPQQLIDLIRRERLQSQILLTGDLETLQALKSFTGESIAVMLHWEPCMKIPEMLQALSPTVVAISADLLKPEVCQELHRAGIKILADVTDRKDSPKDWEACLKAGADWFLTDKPEELLPWYLHRNGLKHPIPFSLHRGASRYAPENTQPAFEKAVSLGAEYLEIDVRTTVDGKHVLLHDHNLDRTTSGTGPISKVSYQEVIGLDAGSWFSPSFNGLGLRTFIDFLTWLPEGIQIYLDAKEITPEDLHGALAGKNLIERTVVYQSAGYLEQLKAIDPRYRAMPPLSSMDEIAIFAGGLKPYAVDVPWEDLSRELIERCHTAGIKVFSDALGENEKVEEYLKAIAWGVDLIQTDQPLKLMRAFEILSASPPGRK